MPREDSADLMPRSAEEALLRADPFAVLRCAQRRVCACAREYVRDGRRSDDLSRMQVALAALDEAEKAAAKEIPF